MPRPLYREVFFSAWETSKAGVLSWWEWLERLRKNSGVATKATGQSQVAQGFLLGIPLGVAGVAIWFAFNRSKDHAVRQMLIYLLIAVAPSVGGWILVWLWNLYRAFRGPIQRLMRLMRSPHRTDYGDGWRFYAENTAEGVTFTAGRSDYSEGWTPRARWVVLDPAGREHDCVFRSFGNAPTDRDEFVWETQKVWPASFTKPVFMEGPHHVSWVVEQTPVFSEELEMTVERL